MACESARKQMEAAKQAYLDAEKRLLKGLSPYIGRTTVVYADDGDKVERLLRLNEEYAEAAKRFHKAVGVFFAFVHPRPEPGPPARR